MQKKGEKQVGFRPASLPQKERFKVCECIIPAADNCLVQHAILQVPQWSDMKKSSLKLGTEDNFSKMSYDPAYSNTTQSQSVTTLYNETSTPYYDDSDLGTPLHTCVQ